MRRLVLGFAALFAVVVVGAVAIHAAPEKVTIADEAVFGKLRKAPVPFNHAAHVEKAGGKCVTCHHKFQGKGEPKKCSACHGKKKEGKKPGLKKAYHKQCKDCHKKAGKKNLVRKCSACHKK